MPRTILHIDANCYYAAVEMLHHPEYEGRPLAVGGDPKRRHGIILTANYIAKRQGVKTGSALWEAKEACPDLVIVPPDYDSYLRFSAYMREIYSEYSDLVEAYGLDENWVDLTDSIGIKGSGRAAAEEISRRVKQELGLTVSIGISWNKIFAKFGSDYKKPDAITEITRENYRQIVWPAPASDLLYVGRSTGRTLKKFGITTIGETARSDPAFLEKILGKMGLVLHAFANGEDRTPVAKENSEPPVKSIGNGMTLPRDLTTEEEVKMAVYMLSESVASRLRKHSLAGDVISMYVRDNSLAGFQKQHRIPVPTNISEEIAEEAMRLFRAGYRWDKPIRGVGVRVENLKEDSAPYQTSLFLDEAHRAKQLACDRAVDEIRRRFGRESVSRGLMYFGPEISPIKQKEQGIHPHSYMERGNQTGA